MSSDASKPMSNWSPATTCSSARRQDTRSNARRPPTTAISTTTASPAGRSTTSSSGTGERYKTFEEMKAKAPVYKHAVHVERRHDVFASGVQAAGRRTRKRSSRGRRRAARRRTAAIDAGQPLPGVNDDFNGKAPDLGAYEIGAAAALRPATRADAREMSSYANVTIDQIRRRCRRKCRPASPSIIRNYYDRDPITFNTDWAGTMPMWGLTMWAKRGVPGALEYVQAWFEAHRAARSDAQRRGILQDVHRPHVAHHPRPAPAVHDVLRAVRTELAVLRSCSSRRATSGRSRSASTSRTPFSTAAAATSSASRRTTTTGSTTSPMRASSTSSR